MKKILLIFLGIIFSVGLFIPSLAYGQNPQITNSSSVYKPEVVEKFEISLSLQTNSDIRIKERIHYYFSTPKHGIYRNIPINKRSEGNRLKTPTSIKINSILYYPSDNPASIGNSYSKEVSLNDEVVLKIGDADRTITGLYIYEIDYTVKNGINYFEDHDELYWNIIGTGWTVPINSVEAKINVPGVIQDTVCYTGVYGSTGTNCQITKESDTSLLLTNTTPLRENEAITIAVSMPKGSIVDVLEKENENIKRNNILYSSSLLLIPLFYLFGSKLKSRKKIVAPSFTPPKDINPLVASYLLSKGRLRSKYITAEIIYLAIQRFIDIEQKERKEYILRKTILEPIIPHPSSEKLFDLLFGSLDEISTKSKTSNLYGYGPTIWEQTRLDAVNNGFVDEKKTKKGLLLAFLGILSLGGAPVALALMLVNGSIFAALSLFVTGISIFIISVFWDFRSEKGNDAYYELLGLKMYINTAEKHRIEFHNDPEKFRGVFESLLPYAIIFGLEKKWMNEFKDLYTTPPDWYTGDMSTFNSMVLLNSVSKISSTIATPVSTGGDFSSGGSGFSGGSSGGGGGGGGGGSW